MGFLAFLNHWWNLPFMVMLGLVGVFFVLQTIGLAGHDGDHDVDADTDADVDHDVDADHDADGDHDADHDADGQAGWSGVLSFFGVGRVPFMVVWVTLFLFCGFSGIFLNRIAFVKSNGEYPGWYFAIVLLIAFLIGLIGVRLFSRLAAKVVDVGGKGATAKHELAGKVGVVASAIVDEKFGEIRVHDNQGNEILVHGRLQAGEAALKRETKVILVDYDAQTELFWVTALPELDSKEAPKN